MAEYDQILQQVGQYYSEKLQSFGAEHRGVDWNSIESQELRFKQLLKIVDDPDAAFSLNDYGCGYGAMVAYLQKCAFKFQYTGFDIAENMIQAANQQYGLIPNCRFSADEQILLPADYTVASGIFNVRLQNDVDRWREYILHTLEKMWLLSTRGMAFNALTSYSDADRMRAYLYYADPCFLFDYCKTHFSRQVALLHDYGLYEFTMLVRRP